MTIDNGVRVRRADPEGDGVAAVRRHAASASTASTSTKGARRRVTGAAFIGWDSTYSFNADGRRIPVERIGRAAYPQRAALRHRRVHGGRAAARSTCRATTVRFRVNDLFVGEEGVGAGDRHAGAARQGAERRRRRRVAAAGVDRHRPHRADAARPTAELTFRFHDSSLDPYVRLFVPKLSPFTTAVASGSIRVVGELADFDHLLVDATVDTARHAPVRLRAEERGADPDHARSADVRVDDLQLVGEDTQLRVVGTDRPARRTHRAAGDGRTRTSASCRDFSATSADRAAPS